MKTVILDEPEIITITCEGNYCLEIDSIRQNAQEEYLVPAGKHEVVMQFDPQTVHTTEAIAYIALSVLALAMIGMIIVTLLINKKKCQK